MIGDDKPENKYAWEIPILTKQNGWFVHVAEKEKLREFSKEELIEILLISIDVIRKLNEQSKDHE